MKLLKCVLAALVLPTFYGATAKADGPGDAPATNLANARTGFATTLVHKVALDEKPDAPPPALFNLVKYPSDIGDLSAYVGVSPKDGKKHPAIIWLVGGFSNSISSIAWTPGPRDNDQSATAFREAGIVMMYPSLRGGNDNPGNMENFYGEVNDVIAAANYLSKLDYVDPKRIYLGGHSTGGTLGLLVAESTDQFRAVFSFGPVEDVTGYGDDVLVFDPKNAREAALRAPVKWLQAIHSPTFVFEGTGRRSNIGSLRAMEAVNKNTAVHFQEVDGASHFATLFPITRLIAKKILQDVGASPSISFTHDEVMEAFKAVGGAQ